MPWDKMSARQKQEFTMQGKKLWYSRHISEDGWLIFLDQEWRCVFNKSAPNIRSNISKKNELIQFHAKR